jgi:hypothetical protein
VASQLAIMLAGSLLAEKKESGGLGQNN